MKITVGISGTGGGFEKFCAGETDINDASRPIEPTRRSPACKKKGIAYERAPGGQRRHRRRGEPGQRLGRLPHHRPSSRRSGSKGSKVNNWNQVDPSSFPDQKMKLFGPGTDSGTFDYFTERDQRREGRGRARTTAPPRTTTSRSRASRAARATWATSASRTTSRTRTRSRPVKVDGGDGCVEPTTDDGPGRQLQAAVAAAVHLPVEEGARRTRSTPSSSSTTSTTTRTIAEQAQFVPMTAEQAQKAKDAVTAAGGLGATGWRQRPEPQVPGAGAPIARRLTVSRRRYGETAIKLVLLGVRRRCLGAHDDRDRRGARRADDRVLPGQSASASSSPARSGRPLFAPAQLRRPAARDRDAQHHLLGLLWSRIPFGLGAAIYLSEYARPARARVT